MRCDIKVKGRQRYRETETDMPGPQRQRHRDRDAETERRRERERERRGAHTLMHVQADVQARTHTLHPCRLQWPRRPSCQEAVGRPGEPRLSRGLPWHSAFCFLRAGRFLLSLMFVCLRLSLLRRVVLKIRSKEASLGLTRKTICELDVDRLYSEPSHSLPTPSGSPGGKRHVRLSVYIGITRPRRTQLQTEHIRQASSTFGKSY